MRSTCGARRRSRTGGPAGTSGPDDEHGPDATVRLRVLVTERRAHVRVIALELLTGQRDHAGYGRLLAQRNRLAAEPRDVTRRRHRATRSRRATIPGIEEVLAPARETRSSHRTLPGGRYRGRAPRTPSSPWHGRGGSAAGASRAPRGARRRDHRHRAAFRARGRRCDRLGTNLLLAFAPRAHVTSVTVVGVGPR